MKLSSWGSEDSISSESHSRGYSGKKNLILRNAKRVRAMSSGIHSASAGCCSLTATLGVSGLVQAQGLLGEKILVGWVIHTPVLNPSTSLGGLEQEKQPQLAGDRIPQIDPQ